MGFYSFYFYCSLGPIASLRSHPFCEMHLKALLNTEVVSPTSLCKSCTGTRSMFNGVY
jgi:hypothetical protein